MQQPIVGASVRFRRPAALALAAVAIAACTPHESPRDRQVVGELPMPTTMVVEPPKPVRATMGEAPAIEPPPVIEPVHVVKGDIAVPNEPCDPKAPSKAEG